MPDQVYGVKWNDVTKKTYTYDGLGRITTETVKPSSNVLLQSTYSYKNLADNKTTTQVTGFTNALGSYSYEYDGVGNITKITFVPASDPTKSYYSEYRYDECNQLTSTYDSRQNRGNSYFYTENGNIFYQQILDYEDESKQNYNMSVKLYGYDDEAWSDKITIYDSIGAYDEIGNPIDYRDGMTFSWQNGRQLATITKPDNTAISYTYNADGQRISKTINDVTTEFIYAGDILAGQKTGNNVLAWIYDNNGKYIGFTYNGSEYYYIYNLQGDVEAIADAAGTIIAKYLYNVWGTIIAVTDGNDNDISSNATHIANINPIRYRGYYYDTETGFYYLQSRYYDPEICRFINADTQLNNDTLGKNLFLYCSNNPINRFDSTGHNWWSNAWNSTKKWASNAWNSTKKWASNAWNSTKKWASNAWNNYVKPSFNRLQNTAAAAFKSLEVEFSSGFGFSGEAKSGGLGANAGAVTKMPKGKISKDGISINECVSELYLTISVGSLEIGPHYTEYTYEGKSEFTWCCVDDTFTIIGGELFLCYGIGAELNFNYKYFCEQVIEIYE